jgi:hypothetical protein
MAISFLSDDTFQFDFTFLMSEFFYKNAAIGDQAQLAAQKGPCFQEIKRRWCFCSFNLQADATSPNLPYLSVILLDPTAFTFIF